MKVKLLKKLRARGRDKVHIHSVTKQGGTTVGMSISYDDDIYSGLFNFGDTEEDVLKKAEIIYMEKYISEKNIYR